MSTNPYHSHHFPAESIGSSVGLDINSPSSEPAIALPPVKLGDEYDRD